MGKFNFRLKKVVKHNQSIIPCTPGKRSNLELERQPVVTSIKFKFRFVTIFLSEWFPFIACFLAFRVGIVWSSVQAGRHRELYWSRCKALVCNGCQNIRITTPADGYRCTMHSFIFVAWWFFCICEDLSLVVFLFACAKIWALFSFFLRTCMKVKPCYLPSWPCDDLNLLHLWRFEPY